MGDATMQDVERACLDQTVRLGDVLEWIEPWVPPPARLLWRKAFVERFCGEVAVHGSTD